jgi:CO/xanthine dehydrogenase Mo-binding subunit
MTVPASLLANPLLSTWLDLSRPGRVGVRTGKVELGQGILTAVAQIVVDELGVAPHRVDVAAAGTAQGPDEGFTAGSLSVTQSGAAVRRACRVLVGTLSTRAAGRTGCAPADLVLDDGCFRLDGAEVSDLWRAAGDGGLDIDVTVDPVPSATVVRPDAAVPRVDLPDKLLGRPRFLHDLRMDAMAHGRVVRPPRPGARLESVDQAPLESLPGVLAVVREGSFLGVVAEDEHGAEVAAAALAESAVWTGGAGLPVDPVAWLRLQPVDTSVVARTDLPPAVAAATMAATYTRGPLAHASIAPGCAVARWAAEDDIRVWTHSQGVHPLRRAMADALGVDPGSLTVQHVEGAGCYGHNGADDVAFDAVLLARRAGGRPVRVQWTRTDELAWSPAGSAMAVDLAAVVGPDGTVTDWSHQVWSNGHTSRPGYAGQPGLLAHSHRRDTDPVPAVDPPAERGSGSARNAVPGYDLGRLDVVAHRAVTMPMRTSALRSLGAHLNVFAIECFLDELAERVGADPLELRLRHLRDQRAADVLRLAAERGGWHSPRAADVGRGIGYARYKNRGAYCAVVAEVEAVDRVAVRRLTVAVDAGRVISADGVRNQLEGGAIQATSWTVKEELRTGESGVLSTDWEAYPILRFSEVPRVDVHVIDRPDEPSLGAGEAAQGPVAAAIGNALADAIGVRVRDLPLTPERVAAAAEAAG